MLNYNLLFLTILATIFIKYITSKNKSILICKVCQLVKLIKDGQPYKMSKRKGDFITIKDVLNDVELLCLHVQNCSNELYKHNVKHLAYLFH